MAISSDKSSDQNDVFISYSRKDKESAGRNLTCEEWQQFFIDEPYSPICADLPSPKDCGKKAEAE